MSYRGTNMNPWDHSQARLGRATNGGGGRERNYDVRQVKLSQGEALKFPSSRSTPSSTQAFAAGGGGG